MSAIAHPPPRTAPPAHGVQGDSTHLGIYARPDGHEREIISTPGADGSTLVIDRDALTHSDERLVAHLPADEPVENPGVMCALYLAEKDKRRYCRAVTPQDRDATAQATPTPWVPGDAWTLVLERVGLRPGPSRLRRA